jgi:hypothetical protein
MTHKWINDSYFILKDGSFIKGLNHINIIRSNPELFNETKYSLDMFFDDSNEPIQYIKETKITEIIKDYIMCKGYPILRYTGYTQFYFSVDILRVDIDTLTVLYNFAKKALQKYIGSLLVIIHTHSEEKNTIRTTLNKLSSGEL